MDNFDPCNAFLAIAIKTGCVLQYSIYTHAIHSICGFPRCTERKKLPGSYRQEQLSFFTPCR